MPPHVSFDEPQRVVGYVNQPEQVGVENAALGAEVKALLAGFNERVDPCEARVDL